MSQVALKDAVQQAQEAVALRKIEVKCSCVARVCSLFKVIVGLIGMVTLLPWIISACFKAPLHRMVAANWKQVCTGKKIVEQKAPVTQPSETSRAAPPTPQISTAKTIDPSEEERELVEEIEPVSHIGSGCIEKVPNAQCSFDVPPEKASSDSITVNATRDALTDEQKTKRVLATVLEGYTQGYENGLIYGSTIFENFSDLFGVKGISLDQKNVMLVQDNRIYRIPIEDFLKALEEKVKAMPGTERVMKQFSAFSKALKESAAPRGLYEGNNTAMLFWDFFCKKEFNKESRKPLTDWLEGYTDVESVLSALKNAPFLDQYFTADSVTIDGKEILQEDFWKALHTAYPECVADLLEEMEISFYENRMIADGFSVPERVKDSSITDRHFQLSKILKDRGEDEPKSFISRNKITAFHKKGMEVVFPIFGSGQVNRGFRLSSLS